MTNCEIIEQEISELEKKQIDYGTAEKLAWLYIVRDHIKHPKTQHTESYADAEPVESMEILEKSQSGSDIIITGSSGSEFLQTIEGKNLECVLMIIDETMDTLQTTLPRIYNNTMAKLRDI